MIASTLSYYARTVHPSRVMAPAVLIFFAATVMCV
jgi:hypothetical protein